MAFPQPRSQDTDQKNVAALEQTATQTQNRKASRDDSVAILHDAMLATPADQDVQLRAITSLIRISAMDDLRLLVGDCGCIQTTISAMRSFPENVSLISKGCMVLANCAFCSEQNKNRIMDCRGIELLIALMGKQESNPDFLRWACLALRNLTHASKENQIEAASFGSMDVLQRILHKNCHFEQLLTQGVAAIGNIAGGDLDCQMRTRESGCIDVIMTAMKYFSSCSFRGHCMISIKKICDRNEKNQMKVLELSGIELIEETLRTNPDNASIILKAFVAIRALCFHERVRGVVGRTGLLGTMLKTLPIAFEKQGGEVASAALKALNNATFSPEANKSILVRCGGIKTIMDLLRVYGENAETVEMGLRVFRNLSSRDGSNYEALAGGRVFSCALDQLGRDPPNANICEQVFVIISSALSAKLDVESFGRSSTETADVVRDQMVVLELNGTTQQIGKGILVALESITLVPNAVCPRRKSRFSHLLRKARSKDAL